MQIAPQLPSAPLRRRRTALQFHVSSPVFVGCWWGIFLVHLTSGIFLFFIGGVHLLLGSDAIYPNIYLLFIEQHTFRIAGWSYIVPALVHFAMMAKDVYRSIRRGHLTFANANRSARRDTKGDSSDQSSSVSEERCFHRLRLRWEALAHSVQVQGHNFSTLMCGNQAVDILSQTYQAYLSSYLVPHKALTRSLVVLVLINCAYLPVIERFTKRSPAFRLTVALIMDLLLDIIVSVVVPLMIIYPYVQSFDWKQGILPEELRFNHLWSVTANVDTRYVLVISWLDNVSTLVPYIGVLESVRTLKHVLMRTQDEWLDASTMISHSTIATGQFPLQEIRTHRAYRWFSKFAAVTATFVIIVHLHAELRPRNTPTATCVFPMNPWFASNTSCAVFELNCYRRGIRGTSDELTMMLEQLDRHAVRKIMISHCPELGMPETITQFPRLLGIHTVNTSITTWPSTAAVTMHNHPMMLQLELVTTNMTDFPQGLLQHSLPLRLSLVIHRSNLTTLPDDSGVYWQSHHWPVFSLVHMPLRTFPASMSKTRIFYLSIFDTEIDSLPDDLFSNYIFTRLRLSNNPSLSSIPVYTGELSFFDVIVAENTNISEPVDWIEKWWAFENAGNQTMSFHGSPLCLPGNPLADADHCTPSRLLEREDHRYALVQSFQPL